MDGEWMEVVQWLKMEGVLHSRASFQRVLKSELII